MPRTPSPPADEIDQVETYRAAVDALGGITDHAAALGMSRRHGGRLYSGAHPLSPSILQDTAKALLQHAEHCRTLERRLSPAFVANLTDHQRDPVNRGGRPRGS